MDLMPFWSESGWPWCRLYWPWCPLYWHWCPSDRVMWRPLWLFVSYFKGCTKLTRISASLNYLMYIILFSTVHFLQRSTSMVENWISFVNLTLGVARHVVLSILALQVTLVKPYCSTCHEWRTKQLSTTKYAVIINVSLIFLPLAARVETYMQQRR